MDMEGHFYYTRNWYEHFSRIAGDESKMRLKSSDGPISLHNVNDVLNSPKRINTLHNSNITANLISTTNLTLSNTINDDDTTTESVSEVIRNRDTLNNVQNGLVEVQWCKSARDKRRELTNNVNNQQQRKQLTNINNTLAVSLRNPTRTRRGITPSVCSESSPDDSLLDYEEAQQSGSSAETTPQEEDRRFDVSDSESLSDDGNLNQRRRHKTILQRRGIVNPNYPGFQRFAHTLDYSIKVSSDTDFTDDDYECELASTENRSQYIEKNDDFNNINNNNNVEETDECLIDKVDSVNRLDSVENIQKVFYDKPVLNLDCENLNQNFSDLESSSNNSNQASDEDTAEITTEKLPFQKIEVKLNIRAEEVAYNSKNFPQETTEDVPEEISHSKYQDLPELPRENIIGDFEREVKDELGRISSNTYNDPNSTNLDALKFDFEINFEPSWERAVVQEIEEAIEKLAELLDFEPAAHKCQLEPNTEEPFCKLSQSEDKFDTTVDLTEQEAIFESNIKEADITENVVLEHPEELLDFEPIDQQFQLEESVEDNSNILSYCEEIQPVILEDSKIIQTNMALTCDNKISEQKTLQAREEVKTKWNSEEMYSLTTRNKSRSFEKMEVESEINELKRDSNRHLEEIECQIKKMKSDTTLSPKSEEEVEKFCKENSVNEVKEKEEEAVPKKGRRLNRSLGEEKITTSSLAA
ncbi:hypothetical protein WA026_017129 [Henosepilachna vigintioctopunctata]|uniref:Uncharacterized protein n=1 Tax=Henosepilachna vigintioctopunctata TaxID=420089 RepID=A0AAW1TLP3_9CUCU